MTHAQVFNLLMAGLPAPQLVRDLDMSFLKELEFILQERKFRVDIDSLAVTREEKNVWASDLECQLLSQLLKKQKQLSNGNK